MAAPAWATNLTTFWLESATTVTAIGTGGAGLGNPETDFFIQGTDCISKAAWTNAIKGFIIDALGTTFTVPTDGAVIAWAKYDAVGSLATQANGGLRVIIGSAAGAYENYYVGGSDTLALNSWVPYVIDPNTATSDATTGSPDGSERFVGLLANLPTTSGPTKGAPIAIDAIRYGRCDVEYTDGDLGNGYNTFSGAESFANDPSRRWGLIENQGAYFIQGFHSFGTASTSVDFRDSNKVLFWRAQVNNVTNDAISTAFNRLEILNASSNVQWDNIIFQALGTRSRGVLVHTAGTFTATSCQFVDMDTFTLLSGSTMTDCVFRRTNAITAPGSTLNGSSFFSPTVVADASVVVWNVATDPDGYLDDTTFSKGTNAHHAIELGTSSPTTITLRGVSTSGFNASNAQNDSTIYVKRTVGTVTINVVGGSGNFSYKTDGATVSVVIDPVTVQVTVEDESTGSPVQYAAVTLLATATGNLPYQDSVSITSTGGTATVTHTAHGLISGKKVVISGADQPEYNGLKTVTVTDANTYTYPVTGSPTSPATGTIISTGVIIDGETDASGQISDTRTYTAAQGYTGTVQQGTRIPIYKARPISGTISTTVGATVGVLLTRD